MGAGGGPIHRDAHGPAAWIGHDLTAPRRPSRVGSSEPIVSSPLALLGRPAASGQGSACSRSPEADRGRLPGGDRGHPRLRILDRSSRAGGGFDVAVHQKLPADHRLESRSVIRPPRRAGLGEVVVRGPHDRPRNICCLIPRKHCVHRNRLVALLPFTAVDRQSRCSPSLRRRCSSPVSSWSVATAACDRSPSGLGRSGTARRARRRAGRARPLGPPAP
jgi:hypothetical protein